MLKINFVKSVEEIPFYKKSYQYFSCPLFHGTRRHMLEMSDEERAIHFQMCDKLIRYTQEIAKNIPEEILNKFINDLHGQGIDTYILFDAYKKTSMYEHGDFYMSFSIETAMSYSRNSGGELSRFAFDCANLLTTLGLEITEDIKPAVDLILDYYDKYENDERVIVAITKIDFADLALEDGTPFLTIYFNEDKLKEEIDDLFDNYHIDKAGVYRQGFRLLNQGKYQMYAFPFDMVNDVVSKVSNVIYKKYLEEGLQMLRKGKRINILPHNYFHDEINPDASFVIEFEILSGEFLDRKVVFPVTFYQNDFVKEHILLDDEAKIPKDMEIDKCICYRVAFRIYQAYKRYIVNNSR